MCLAVPGKVIEVRDGKGVVDIMGVRREVNFELVGEVKVGDWVIVHVGFAIQRMGEEEALRTLKLWEEVLKSV